MLGINMKAFQRVTGMDCFNKIKVQIFNSPKSSHNTVLLNRSPQWGEVPFLTSPFPNKAGANTLQKKSKSKDSWGPNFCVLAPGVNTSRPPSSGTMLTSWDFWRGIQSKKSHLKAPFLLSVSIYAHFLSQIWKRGCTDVHSTTLICK